MVMEYYKADYGCQPVAVTKAQWLSRTAGWPGSHTGVTVTLSRSTRHRQLRTSSRMGPLRSVTYSDPGENHATPKIRPETPIHPLSRDRKGTSVC